MQCLLERTDEVGGLEDRLGNRRRVRWIGAQVAVPLLGGGKEWLVSGQIEQDVAG